MQTIGTVGLDIAKSVFQVHCVDGAGQWSFAVQEKILGRSHRFFQRTERCHAGGATRTSAFPKLRPSNIPMKAAGAFSRPSVTSSR